MKQVTSNFLYTMHELSHDDQLNLSTNCCFRNSQNKIFPCSNPCTPAMSRLSTRITTFKNWHPLRTRASAGEFAEAGFFYLGISDRVKCFYCNGGLQNWKFEQKPWFEHAKWFPNCEYLLRNKGVHNVEAIASKFPNITRPLTPTPVSTRNHEGHPLASSTSLPQVVADEISSTSPSRLSTSSSSSVVMTEKRLVEAMKNSVVTEAIAFGFDIDLIKNLVRRKLANNTEYTTVRCLVEEIQTEEKEQNALPSFTEEGHRPERNSVELQEHHRSGDVEAQSRFLNQTLNTPTSSHYKLTETMISNTATSRSSPRSERNHVWLSREEVNKNIRNYVEEKTCKVCLDRQSNCIFLPCKHLCCCIDCGSALTKCPICRSHVNKIYRIYFDEA